MEIQYGKKIRTIENNDATYIENAYNSKFSCVSIQVLQNDFFSGARYLYNQTHPCDEIKLRSESLECFIMGMKLVNISLSEYDGKIIVDKYRPDTITITVRINNV